MSLFDDYPDAHSPGGPRSSCCDGYGDRPLVEQFIHVLAHSRVPFTLRQVVGLTDGRPEQVARLIDRALGEGHLAVVEPEAYMAGPTNLVVGRLARRR